MRSNQQPRDNLIATRGRLVTFIGRQLAPLYNRPQFMVELAEWLAALPCEVIAGALHQNATQTAAALADALTRDTARRYPQDAISDLIAVEFPKLGHIERAALAAFTQAARTISIKNQGEVTEQALTAAGFGSAKRIRHMERATRLLAILDGAGETLATEGGATPAGRLLEAGSRSAVRLSFAA